MGWTLFTDDIEEHEGYLVRILENGDRISAFGGGIPDECTGVEVECGCGWTGDRWLAPTGTWRGFEGHDLHEEDARKAWEKHASAKLVLIRLAQTARAARLATFTLKTAIAGAALSGASWAEIGLSIGISEKAAREKYGSP